MSCRPKPFVDTEPPVIDRCRSPPTVQATDTETAVVWEVPQFSDNSGMSGGRFLRRQLRRGFILLLLCSTPLHPLPPLMMVKQDLFHRETGKRGSGGELHVCVNNGERHWTYGPMVRCVIVCMNASFVCLCSRE